MLKRGVGASVTRLIVFALSLLVFCPQALAQQVVNGCQIFPPDNIWNRRIDGLKVDKNSKTYVNSLGKTTAFHPDVGSDINYFGIPYNIVPGNAPKSPVSFDYWDESDPGPYPVSTALKIEGGTWGASNGGDRHVLMVDTTNQVLYELFYTWSNGGAFQAGSGAVFPLNSNRLRPAGWTSADAAGLPIFPGLLNSDEVASGVVRHALRFTCRRTNGYIWPARHKAGPQTKGYPPMGQRFRLKAAYDISSFSPRNRVILTALKQYGMFVADNGSNWFLNGAPDPRWSDSELDQLKRLRGIDFEAVNESSLMVSPDSGQSR